MRELHVVALSEDGRHVVLATRAGAASGEFLVALDERLTAAVRGELPAPGRDAPPSISPRDIQTRLRSGEAPEEIAASAGVPLGRVERYAGPVLAELDRMITGARAAVVSRPRLGASALPLGEAVETHLAEVAHLAEGSVRWSARRTDLGRWVVEVSWTARGRRRTAGWHYDPALRKVAAVDGPSAVLGHVEAETAAAPASGRSARPAAPAPAVRGAGRAGGATATARSRGAAVASAGSPPQAAGSPAARAGASAPTTSRRTSGPPPAPAASAPAPATRRRAASTPAPAAVTPPARRPPATPPAAEATRATSAPARTSAGQAPARRTATAEQPPARGTAATGRAQPRRTAPRRSAVPPLDDLAAATAGAAAPPSSPETSSADRTPAPSLPGPPVLRVVPPADPEPAQDTEDAAPSPGTRPARRAAGQRAGGRDWADVLMGAAPAAPAAEPRQD